MNAKTTRKKTVQQETQQRNKNQNCSSWKILGTILKMDEGGAQINGPENKKVNDDGQSLTPER